VTDLRHLAPVNPELVWIGGPDAVRFLNDLISQEIAAAEPGEVKRSLLLTPQGKLDHIFWVLRGEDEVGLLVEDGRGDALMSTLSRYRIRVNVEIEKSQLEPWLVIGPVEVEVGSWSGDHSKLVADVSWPGLGRALMVGERPQLALLDPEEYDLLRIEAGEPLMDVDVSDATIPQETGLVRRSISFEKGCFLGQELVARLDSRGGRVNRHLRILRFDDRAPAAGTELVQEGRSVGVLTSAANDKGLALLWRDVEPGDVVTAGDVAASVEAVPGE